MAHDRMTETNEYGNKTTGIDEYLYWGGLVRPSVLRQKDYSFLSIMEYQPFSVDIEQPFIERDFCAGWGIWNEHHYIKGGETGKDYLVVFWHPFLSNTQALVENTLGRKSVHAKNNEEIINYFASEVQRILQDLQGVTTARLLEYQEILDVLYFSLSLEENTPVMPEIPLYLDVLLSQDLSFRFEANDIFINDKRAFVVSILAPVDTKRIYKELASAYPGVAVTFRHVRRFMFFNEAQAKKNFHKYTSKWFPARSVIRKMATEDILGKYNGYLTDTFIFYLTEEQDEAFSENFAWLLDELQASYIVERFNLKQVFWGACIGNYQANQFPPLVGLQTLPEIMTATVTQKEKEKENVLENAKKQLVQTTVDVEGIMADMQDEEAE